MTNFLSATRARFRKLTKFAGKNPLREHGVTAAEQLKLLPLMYCYTGDKEALELANLAYRKVEGDSLMPDGGIVSSESLGHDGFQFAARNVRHHGLVVEFWIYAHGERRRALGGSDRTDDFQRAAGRGDEGLQAVAVFFECESNPGLQHRLPAHRADADVVSRGARDGMLQRQRQSRDAELRHAYVDADGRRRGRDTVWPKRGQHGDSAGEPAIIAEETDYPFREIISFKIKISKPASRLRWACGFPNGARRRA
jgi:hypothetical protein